MRTSLAYLSVNERCFEGEGLCVVKFFRTLGAIYQGRLLSLGGLLK